MYSSGFIKAKKLTKEEESFNDIVDSILQAFIQNRISAFVGTGFSLNAKPIDPKIHLPLWPQVGIELKKEFERRDPSNIIDFEDPIKLAGLFSAQYTHDELDNFLEKIINDVNFEPKQVHKKFVELNWNNIFTTNYDTLLERADEETFNRYIKIKDDKEIPKAGKPRIVKLHGSFTDAKPYIMTEEDFRTYQQNHEIFITEVKYSFVNDTIILLGFSGDDPNFMNWSGWLRDQLEKDKTNNIVLISVNKLSTPEKKYFEKNNIKILDLNIYLNRYPTTKLSDLFIKLFDFWNNIPDTKTENITNNKELIEWIEKLWKPKVRIEQEIKKNNFDKLLKEVTKNWKNERKTYPGNIALPYNYNNQLFWKTRDFVDDFVFLKKLDNNEQSINFLYELDWRWNLCGIPLFKHTIESYKKAIGFEEKKYKIKIKKFPKTVQKKALKLLITLYKTYREDGDNQICTIIEKIISANNALLEKDDKEIFYYQTTLTLLYKLKYKAFLKQINNWNLPKSNIRFNIIKAGLLAETGNEQEAIKLLQNLQKNLTNKLKKKPKKLEYLFQENLINWLLIWIHYSTRFTKDFPDFHIEEENLRKRNKQLATLGCDIIEILNTYSKDIYVNKQKKLEKKEFDNIRSSQMLINSEEAPFASFIYMNMFERIGFPYKINNSTLGDSGCLEIAINNILKYQPDWALFLIIRSYNENYVENNIGYEELQTFNTKGVSFLINSLLDCFQELQGDLVHGTDYAAKDFCNRIIKTYPELLSRLCYKADSNAKERLIDFLITIIKKNLVCRMPNIEKLIKRFIKTLKIEDKVKLIQEISKLKAPNYRPIDTTRQLNPLLQLYPQNESELKGAKFTIQQNDITNLIKRYEKTTDTYVKKWYLTSLITLAGWNLLDNGNSKLFGEALWKTKLDEFNLPTLDGFYKSVLLRLPHPDNIDINACYSNMLMNTSIPIISKQGIITYPQDSGWYENICHSRDNNKYSEDFWIKTLQSIEKQWNEDSKYLAEPDEPFNSYKQTVLENFRYSSLILQRMIQDNYNSLNNRKSKLYKYRNEIKNLINDYYKNNVKCFEAMAALILLDKKEENYIVELFNEMIASSERNDVVEVLNAINFLLKQKTNIYPNNKKSKLIDLIIESVFWQSKGDMEDCLRACKYIIKLDNTLINDKQIYKLCTALKNIRKSFENSENKIDVQYIEIKTEAVGLAYMINSYLIEKHLEIPPEISIWKSISDNEDEFVKIKNQWESE